MVEPDPVIVAAGVIRDEATGRLLLTRRAPDAHLGGLWEFPGGKVQAGETPREALARELLEEVGVTVDVGRLLLEETHAYPDRTVHIHFFECRIAEGQASPPDTADRVWCSPGKLDRYEMPEANDRLVARLRTTA